MPHFRRGTGKITSEENLDYSEGQRRPRKYRSRKYRRYRRIRLISYASVLVMAVFTLTVLAALNHYRIYPGRVESESLSSPGRGSDFIIVSWDDAHSTDVYKVWYKEIGPAEAVEEVKEEPESGPEQEAENQNTENKDAEKQDTEKEETVIDDSWTELETDVPEITVRKLKPDTSYAFIVRADSKENEGAATEPRSFSTKRTQKIKVSKKITKFTFSEPFRPKVTAETDVMYETSDPEVAVVNPETQEIEIVGAGDAEITVTAKSSTQFESASNTIDLKVIESTPVSAGGASARNIYHLDPDNCEIVKSITGAEGAVIPQGLGYSGDKYYVVYGMGSPNRIISFDVDGDGKSVSKPKVSMGHPNGLAFADENGRCYIAKGWTSKVFTYEPTSNTYGSVNMPYGCSGIGYDRKEKLLYTCSRTAMVACDISDGYSVKYRCGVVKHSGKTYTQDCGGHAGIMLRCLSGSDKHGTNYIDLYDMKNGRYLGTITCELSEVESCIVDKDGFLEILANNSSSVDYIWKTDLNIETLGEGL